MHENVVFLGPSLELSVAQEILPACYLPPAARGDIPHIVANGGVRVICLIDGVFFQECAVGHREILAAIKNGVTVFGSSSMGALRASELDTLGMKGIGEIYRRYKTGEIISDDEVALVYDPETWISLSVPLVNIRYTIEEGIKEKVISEESGIIILKASQSLYYPERTYPRVLSLIQGRIPQPELSRFSEYIKKGGKDLKRMDAIMAITAVRDYHLSLV